VFAVPLPKLFAQLRRMVPPAHPFQELVRLRLAELSARDRRVKRSTGVTSTHLTQGGLERLGTISRAQPFCLITRDAPGGHHPVELPEYPLLALPRPLVVLGLPHDQSVAFIPYGGMP
jgi:hypothetical protein